MKRKISLIVVFLLIFSVVHVFAGDVNDTYNTNIPDSVWQSVVDTQGQGSGDIMLYDQKCVARGDFGTYFTATNPSEGNLSGDSNDTYLMLTPKEDGTDESSVTKMTFVIRSGTASKAGGSSGHLYFSMNFKINDLRTTDSMSKRMLTARLGFSPVWNYALKVGTLKDTQTITYNGETVQCVEVGLGSVDSDNMTTSRNAWVPRGVWCKYYIDVNYYTKTCTVGVINLETDEEIFDPYVTTINTSTYPYTDNEVTIRVERDAGEICIDDIRNIQDIYVHDETSKSIAVENNEITASIKLGNDILTSAYNPAYTSQAPVLILVAYDNENRMLDMRAVDTGLQRTKTAKGATTLQEVSVSMPMPQNCSYATAMLWNCQGNMSSLCEYWSTR